MKGSVVGVENGTKLNEKYKYLRFILTCSTRVNVLKIHSITSSNSGECLSMSVMIHERRRVDIIFL